MQFLRLLVLVSAVLNFSLYAAWTTPESDRKVTRQRCEERYTRIVNSTIATALYAHQASQPGKKFVLRPGQFAKKVTFMWSADDSFVSWFEDQITGYLGFVYGETNSSPMIAMPPLHPRDYWTMGWVPEADEIRQLVTAKRQVDMDQKKACAEGALQPHLLKDLRILALAYLAAEGKGISVQDLLDLGWPKKPRKLLDQNAEDTLQLCGFGLTSLQGLQANEAEMKTIKCIDLRCNDFESIVGEDEAVLAQFKNLQALILDGNKNLAVTGKFFMTIPSLQLVSVNECTALLRAQPRKKWYEEPLSFGGQYNPSGMRVVYERDPGADFTEEIRRDAREQDQKRQASGLSVEEDSMGDCDRHIPIHPLADQTEEGGGKDEERE